MAGLRHSDANGNLHFISGQFSPFVMSSFSCSPSQALAMLYNFWLLFYQLSNPSAQTVPTKVSGLMLIG